MPSLYAYSKSYMGERIKRGRAVVTYEVSDGVLGKRTKEKERKRRIERER